MIYFWKWNDTRTSKTMFPGAWHPNTQIHKYTNTVWVKLEFFNWSHQPYAKTDNVDWEWKSRYFSKRARTHASCVHGPFTSLYFSTALVFSLLKQTVSVVKKNLKKWCFEFSSTINGCATLFVFWRDTKSVAQLLIVELNSKTPFFKNFLYHWYSQF